MKIPIKVLLTIVVSGLVWVATQFSLEALNQPRTTLVLVGLLGFTISLYIWYAVVNWLWNVTQRIRSLYHKIRKEN